MEGPSAAIARSQAWCRRVMRREAKSSYVASRFLPADKREALEALYGLFRSADNVTDEPGYTIDDRRRGLAAIRSEVLGLADPGCRGRLPWFAAVRRAFARFPLDPSEVLTLVAACEREIEGHTIATLDDLERYARAVSGSVARCTMRILGTTDPDSLERAEKLAVALQCTNALRDEEADTRSGRSYMPYPGFGGDVETTREAVVRLARAGYAQAPVLAARVADDGSRFTLLVAAQLYEDLLARVVASGFCTGKRRPPRIGLLRSTWFAARLALQRLFCGAETAGGRRGGARSGRG
jgi:phytoene/squalene synthetase